MRFQLDPLSPSGVSVAPEPQKAVNKGGYAGSPDITRVIQPGTNVTFTGNGTQQSPYVVNATGGSGGGQVNTIVPGTGILVDSSNPVNPIVSADFTADTLHVLKAGDTMTGNLLLSSTATSAVQLFNTVDQVTNFEKVTFSFVSNSVNIVTSAGGTGTVRNFVVGTAAAQAVFRNAPGSGTGYYTFGPTIAGTGAIGTNLVSNVTTSSGTSVVLAIQHSVNQSGTAGYTSLLINPTETATGSGNKFMADFQTGSTSYFQIGTAGVNLKNGVNLNSNTIVPNANATYALGSTSNYYTNSYITRLNLNSTAYWDGGTAGAISTTAATGLLTTAPTHTLTLGSTATGIVYYNTTDQTTNYERALVYWTSNIFTIRTQNGGTGGLRGIQLATASGRALQLNDAASSPSGSSQSAGFINMNSGTATAGAVNVNIGGTWTSSSGLQYPIAISPIINQTSTAGYTALLVNPTETATGSGSKLLMDLQVGSSSKYAVTNQGYQVVPPVTVTVTGTIAQPYTRVNSASATTQTLPTSPATGTILFIKNINTGMVTFSGTIDGNAAYTLPTQYKYVYLQYNGTNWDVIGNN